MSHGKMICPSESFAEISVQHSEISRKVGCIAMILLSNILENLRKVDEKIAQDSRLNLLGVL